MLRARRIAALSVPFGVVLGHLVGYGVGHPDDDERAIAEAGHAYLASLTKIAVPLLLLSLLAALLAGTRRTPLRPRLLPAAVPLVVVFTGVELFEHLTAGWPLEHVLTEPSLWLGLLTQLAVAAVVVVVQRLLVHVGTRLAASGSMPAPRAASAQVDLSSRIAIARTILLTSIRRRGPPRLLRVA